VTRRLVGLALLAAAVLVHAGVTLPARRARDEARAAYAAKREERERLRAELGRLERRSSARGSAASEDAAAAARALRQRLLAATAGIALADVQIATRPERQGGVAARGRLAGLGRQADVLRVADRLANPGSGVVLERLDLAQRPGGVQLEAEATRLRGGL
jgi:hypothetical protein